MAPRTNPIAQQAGGDRNRGEYDTADRQERDGPQVVAKLAPAHRNTGRIDERRQDEHQHQFGHQFDPWQAGHERQGRAGKHEKNRTGGMKAVRCHGHNGNCRQHEEPNLEVGSHMQPPCV